MNRKEERVKMKQLLVDAITLLCRSGMQFEEKFCIEALIAITLDDHDVVLININETIDADGGDCFATAVETAESVPKIANRRRANKSKNESRLEKSSSEVDPVGMYKSTSFYDSNTFVESSSTNTYSDAKSSSLKSEVKFEHQSDIDDGVVEGQSNHAENCSNFIAEETENTDDCFFIKSEEHDMSNMNVEWSAGSTDMEYNNIDPGKSSGMSSSFQFQPSHRKFRGRGRPSTSRANWRLKPTDSSKQCRVQYRTNFSSPPLQEQVQVDGDYVTIGRQLNKWQCNLCSTIYSSERVLREHVKAIHFHKMLGHCKDCGESFKWRHQLQKHKRSCPAAFNF